MKFILRASVFVKGFLSMPACSFEVFGEELLALLKLSGRKSLLMRNAYKTITIRPKSHKIFAKRKFELQIFSFG